MKFLDNEQKKQIGYHFIMDELGVTTAFGLDEKKHIKPYKLSEIHKLKNELDYLERIIDSINLNTEEYKKIGRIFCKIKDIKNSLNRCVEGEILDEVELFEIKYFSSIVIDLKEILDRLNLDIEEIMLFSQNDVLELLNPPGKNISTFYIYDEYSEKLKAIRNSKKKKENKIFEEKDENLISELKKERLDLVIEEENEEKIIRKELSSKLLDTVDIMLKNIRAIGKLDFLIAKANLAIEYNCIKPNITSETNIEFKNAFNPEIKKVLEKQKKKFTPISIALEGGTTIITGANMGGKSVTLKTIVLNLLLGQMGFFVFAEKAEMPLLQFIYFISDDMQSISKGLSTFGAEIIKLKEVIECAKKEIGFIALDEFARGTNPKEGYYLVKSLSKYLTKFETVSLISTHYDGVVENNMQHYQVIGLKNTNFDILKQKIDLNRAHSVEILQEHMEYKLEKVSKENKVPKDALNVAILLGLETEIVEIAKMFYNEEE